MNSKTLKEDGFIDFYPLKELAFLNMPKDEGHVFVLIDRTLTDKPTSDILYIGRARKPVKKVFGGYLGGAGGRTTKKIHKTLFNDNYIEKTSISWMASDNPRTTQRELLEKFRSIHGEYPPWNPPRKVATKKKPNASQKPRKPAVRRTQRTQ